jgi:uncharacterized alpha-E superfamily protein
MMLARVADSFYWMNRYLERVEYIARLIGLQLERLPASPARDIAEGWRRLCRSLGTQPPGADTYSGAADEDDFLFADGCTLADYLTFEAANPNSIMFCLTAARENARQVRDAISSAIWSSLNQRVPALAENRARRRLEARPRHAVSGRHPSRATIRRHLRKLYASGHRMALHAPRAFHRARPARWLSSRSALCRY